MQRLVRVTIEKSCSSNILFCNQVDQMVAGEKLEESPGSKDKVPGNTWEA